MDMTTCGRCVDAPRPDLMALPVHVRRQVMDVLDHENKKSLAVMQREDLHGLGQALLSICARTPAAASNVVQ